MRRKSLLSLKIVQSLLVSHKHGIPEKERDKLQEQLSEDVTFGRAIRGLLGDK